MEWIHFRENRQLWRQTQNRAIFIFKLWFCGIYDASDGRDDFLNEDKGGVMPHLKGYSRLDSVL